MFCSSCGNKLNENAKFCSKCGMKVEKVSETVNIPQSSEQPIIGRWSFLDCAGVDTATAQSFADEEEYFPDGTVMMTYKRQGVYQTAWSLQGNKLTAAGQSFDVSISESEFIVYLDENRRTYARSIKIKPGEQPAYCTNCGGHLTNGVRLCRQCGYDKLQVAQQIPSASSSNEELYECDKCGTNFYGKLAKCPKCNLEFDWGAGEGKGESVGKIAGSVIKGLFKEFFS
jgi:uncharacterized OB-fold protein